MNSMKHIELLPKELIDKIAAGEVVVNGASVLKELLENSIDANSKTIAITIKNGGKSLIKVVDDGDGIPHEDLPKAFLRNATSKLSGSLDSISTLGFRGEALASISFAADISVITRTAGEQIGTLARVIQNDIISQNEISCNQGTIIEVSDLFRTIPVRLKYLKKDQVETEAILDVCTKTALAHPEISFRMICDGKELFYTNGNGNVLECLASVMGQNAALGMIRIDIDDAPLYVSGYIASPAFSADKNWKYIILNGRYIISESINKAIDQIYKEYYGRTGASFLLYIQIPYHMVDVNVHPSKLEVKILNESLILMLIKQGIRDALKKEFIIRESSLQTKTTYIIPPTETFVMEEAADYIPEKINSKNVILPVNDGKSTGEGTSTLKLNSESKTEDGQSILIENKYQSGIVDKSLILKISNMRYIGNAFGLYAIFEMGEELFAIDTHAAHERVLYEKYLHAFQAGSIAMQPLMLPILIAVSNKIRYILLNNIDNILKIGFEIDEFDTQYIAIRSIPYYFTQNEAEFIVLKLADEISDVHTTDQFMQRSEKLLKIACHNAVRGSENISENEVRALIKDLYETEMPYTCPHGRPILGKIHQKYFMKMFERI